MERRYRVIVVGMGKRGNHHASGFRANPRFELVGICDIDRARLEAAAPALGHPRMDTDAAALARAVGPDVFCFCTLPQIRLPMIEIAIACGAKLIAFEKPIALTSREGLRIKAAIERAGVKAVVSHQHRYGEHYRKVEEIVASGELGRVHTVYGTATGWLMHMLTHLIDYMRWYAGEPEAAWAMAQAAGRGKLSDPHPSPDYLAGFIQFANGVRGIVETGAGAPDVPEVEYWWRKCRIGAQGTDGFAEVLTGGGWRAVTKRGAFSGGGKMDYATDMPPYIQDIAEWLDDPAKVHPCAFPSAWKGFEIAMALARSAIEGGQIPLPLAEGADEIAGFRRAIPERRVLLSMPENAKEYG